MAHDSSVIPVRLPVLQSKNVLFPSCWSKLQYLLLLCKKGHQRGSFSFILTELSYALVLAVIFLILTSFTAVIFSPPLFLLCAGGICYYFSPEEPPPRPPQPAVLIKSKSGFSQQLFTHCSCPLCSLLAPLLKGTSQSFSSFLCLSLWFFCLTPPCPL